VLTLFALWLMLWVAPVRRRAVLVIWGASCCVAMALVFASYFFRPTLFWQGMLHARWLDFDPRALAASVAYRHGMQAIFRGSPAMVLALPVALAVLVAWKRARYFGNFAPLGIALVLFAMGMAAPSFPGQGFQTHGAGVPFRVCRGRVRRFAGDPARAGCHGCSEWIADCIGALEFVRTGAGRQAVSAGSALGL